MSFHRIVVGLALGLLLPACGSESTPMMSNYVTDMDRRTEVLRSELSSHSGEIATAPDLDAMARAEAAHWQRSHDRMAEMVGVMGDMMSCRDGRGSHFDQGGFSDVMRSMRIECDRHRDAMRDATDIEARRAEEAQHQAAMGAQIDRMHDQIDATMGMAGGYSCGDYGHCM